jgi:hypothetical protein
MQHPNAPILACHRNCVKTEKKLFYCNFPLEVWHACPYILFIGKRKGAHAMFAYCDRIAHDIRDALRGSWLETVSNVRYDLHPVGKYMISTKKTIEASDSSGKRYRITVEEIE